jgi:hypothetical protein
LQRGIDHAPLNPSNHRAVAEFSFNLQKFSQKPAVALRRVFGLSQHSTTPLLHHSSIPSLSGRISFNGHRI